jgi:integrase
VQEVRGKLKRQPYTKTDKDEKKRHAVELDDDLLAALRDQQTRQQTYKRECSDWQEHGLIFPSSVGTPFHPRSFDRQYKKILQQAGVPTKRIHDMRHTAGSLMGLNGASAEEIRDVLGHSTTRMTEKYIHSYNEGRRRAIESTGRQLKRGAE